MSSLTDPKKTPSFVLYIISLTTSLMIASGIGGLVDSFMNVELTATQAAAAYDNGVTMLAISILAVVGLLTLRRSFGLITFILNFVLELIILNQLSILPDSSDKLLYMSLTTASLFGIFVSKFFRANVNDISNKPLTKNIVQVIPAVAIIMIFAGSTLATTLGLNPVSQQPDPQYFNVDNVNFNLFNVPSWNAQYYLDNILDQFQAGINDPFKPVFNVTNNTPDSRLGSNQKISSYLKEETFFAYKYDAVKAKSGTFFPADTGLTSQNQYLSGTTYNQQTFSQPVPDKLVQDMALDPSQRTYNAYDLTVSMPINHTSLYDESLPVPWNSRTYGSNGTFYGSFINPNSTEVYTNTSQLLYTCPPSTTATTLSSCAFTENEANIQNFPGISDVGLRLDGFPSQGFDQILNYSMNYLEPNVNYLNSYSQPINYYSTVFDANTWAAIRNTYLQLPSDVNGTAPAGFASYADWAPYVYQAASQYITPSASVMTNIFSLINAMTPAIDPSYLPANTSLPSTGGPMGLTYDIQNLVAPSLGSTPVAGVDYPAPGDDYVNWFLSPDVKHGLSANFASAATMILRAAGIPARFVTGYALGNTSSTASSNPYVTVYQRLHKMAWAEALVPLDTPQGPSFEWVIVDPIGGSLAAAYGLNLLGSPSSGSASSYDFTTVVDPFSFNTSADLSTFQGQNNLNRSIFRVGVDQKNTTTGLFDGTLNSDDTGFLGSNGPNIDTTTGMVHVGVYVMDMHVDNGAITSFHPAAQTYVTFQVVFFDNNTKTYEPMKWNETFVKAVALTDSATGFAMVTFQYQPYYANFTTVLHGPGPANFVAILGNTLTIGGPGCETANCTSGMSDQNRNDDSFNVLNITQNAAFVYDPVQFVLGPPPLLLMNMQQINTIQTSSASYLTKIQSFRTDKVTQSKIIQNIEFIKNIDTGKDSKSSLADILALGLVFTLLQYVVVEKRKNFI